MTEYSKSPKISSDESNSQPLELAPDAFYGLAGEIVHAVEPHTEADPAGLLIQLLVAFGNLVGRGPHFSVDGVRHGLNMFVVLVGLTGKGRKGTSWSRVRSLFEIENREWCAKQVQTGLSSGEGLIWAIRDPIDDAVDEEEKKGRGQKKQSLGDPGIEDKRLLVFESEFASVLKMGSREGNTLSPIIRQAWDGQTLQVLTKNSPHKATDPHISIIGHITQEELKRSITATEQANGFANRFLWVLVRRSKFLADGGNLNLGSLLEIVNLRYATKFAQRVNQMHRDSAARDLWHQLYPVLSGDRFGLHGAVTGRAEAQVLRLSCLYALLDEQAVIGVEHLRAALAVWDYCDSSARRVFGDSLGDATADEILKILREGNPLSKTEISGRLHRNKDAAEIARALGILAQYGLANSTSQNTSGRKAAEIWSAVSIGSTSDVSVR